MNYWRVRNAWEGPARVCIKRPLGRAVKEREMPAALLSCGFLRFQVSHSLFSLLLPLPTLRSCRARSCSSWKWKVFSTSRLPGSAAVPLAQKSFRRGSLSSWGKIPTTASPTFHPTRFSQKPQKNTRPPQASSSWRALPGNSVPASLPR